MIEKLCTSHAIGMKFIHLTTDPRYRTCREAVQCPDPKSSVQLISGGLQIVTDYELQEQGTHSTEG